MKKYLSKKLFLSLVIILTIIVINGNVNAAGGQASGSTNPYGDEVSKVFELIRAMETKTGTLGVTSNIDTSNYVDSSGNGIDCHMQKNTEYGTMALLASSEYGNKSSTSNTSTGLGETGVYHLNENPPYEYVANTWSTEVNGSPIVNTYNKALTNADSRYVDKYYGKIDDFIDRGYVIRGDGIFDFEDVRVSNFVQSSLPVFSRVGFRGITAYKGDSLYNSRAVVVCAPGL